MIKERIIWHKMIFNLGSAWISDGILVLFGVPAILANGYIVGIILLIMRYIVGYTAYELQLPQIENRLHIVRLNPHLQKGLYGSKRARRKDRDYP